MEYTIALLIGILANIITTVLFSRNAKPGKTGDTYNIGKIEITHHHY